MSQLGRQEDDEGNHATKVTHPVAGRRNQVHLAIRGHVGQEAIVEEVAARVADDRQDVQKEQPLPLLGRQEGQAKSQDDCWPGEDVQPPALGVGVISQGTQEWGQQRDHQGAETVSIAPIGRRVSRTDPRLLGHGLKVDGQDRGHN